LLSGQPRSRAINTEDYAMNKPAAPDVNNYDDLVTVHGTGVRMAKQLSCPHCGKLVRAGSVGLIDGSRWRMTCDECHRVIIESEA
jgi:hypothetical protein